MNTLDVLDVINELTIKIVKLKIERLEIRSYLSNGGNPEEIEKYLSQRNIALERPF